MWAIPYKWLTLGCLGQFYPATGGKCKLPETYCSEIGLLLAEDVAWQSFACHCNCWRGTIHGQSTRFFHFIEKWFKTATREIAWNLREIPSLTVKYQVYPWKCVKLEPLEYDLFCQICVLQTASTIPVASGFWVPFKLKGEKLYFSKRVRCMCCEFNFFSQKSWFCCEIGIGSWYLSSLFWSNH